MDVTFPPPDNVILAGGVLDLFNETDCLLKGVSFQETSDGTGQRPSVRGEIELRQGVDTDSDRSVVHSIRHEKSGKSEGKGFRQGVGMFDMKESLESIRKPSFCLSQIRSHTQNDGRW